jgi:hypothetical protein
VDEPVTVTLTRPELALIVQNLQTCKSRLEAQAFPRMPQVVEGLDLIITKLQQSRNQRPTQRTIPVTDTELIRHLFSKYAAAHNEGRLADTAALSDVTLYAAHLRFLVRIFLRTESVIELLSEPGLPELRAILKCLIEMEAKVGFTEELRIKNPLERP